MARPRRGRARLGPHRGPPRADAARAPLVPHEPRRRPRRGARLPHRQGHPQVAAASDQLGDAEARFRSAFDRSGVGMSDHRARRALPQVNARSRAWSAAPSRSSGLAGRGHLAPRRRRRRPRPDPRPHREPRRDRRAREALRPPRRRDRPRHPERLGRRGRGRRDAVPHRADGRHHPAARRRARAGGERAPFPDARDGVARGHLLGHVRRPPHLRQRPTRRDLRHRGRRARRAALARPRRARQPRAARRDGRGSVAEGGGPVVDRRPPRWTAPARAGRGSTWPRSPPTAPAAPGVRRHGRGRHGRGRGRARELAAREAEYRVLAEHSGDCLSRHDLDGRYLYVSPASEAILGYRPEELVGRTAAELGFIHPEDAAHVGELKLERGRRRPPDRDRRVARRAARTARCAGSRPRCARSPTPTATRTRSSRSRATSPSARTPRRASPTRRCTTRSPGCRTARCSSTASSRRCAARSRSRRRRRGAVRRPRPLQARQRHLRPRRRRPAAVRRRRAAAPRAAPGRHGRPLRRRRVRRPVRGRRRRGRARARSRAGSPGCSTSRSSSRTARRSCRRASASRSPAATRGPRTCCATPTRRCTAPRTAAAPRVEVFDEAMRRDARERVATESALRRAIERDELCIHYQPVVGIGDGAHRVRSRRWCAGSIPSAGSSRRATSSRSPRRPG